MNKSAAISAFLGGRVLVCGIYMSGKGETISWRDSKTKVAMSAPNIRHTVLVNGNAMTVSERPPEVQAGQPAWVPESYVSPFAQMTPVVVEVSEMEMNRGVYIARGTIAALTEDQNAKK